MVTGGTGYLGSENVKILKDFGATVVNADLAAAETRWNKEEEGAADLFVACDVSSSDSIAACFKTVAGKYGKIDILVNCACYGAGYGKESQLEYMDEATFHRGVDGSVGVAFRGMREVVPYMKQNGGSNVTSSPESGECFSIDAKLFQNGPIENPSPLGGAP